MKQTEPTPPVTSCGSPYAPIDSSQGEIRLLLIEPGEYGDDIVINLLCVHLSEQVPYTTLSYMWGDTQSPGACTIKGVVMTINRNLDRALRRFREESNVPVLWADALCIDQTNLVERAAQVQLMKRIYEGADEIFAWLGDLQVVENIEAAFAMIDPFCERISAKTEEVAYTEHISEKVGCDGLDAGKYDNFFPTTIDTDVWRAWEGITEMFTCEYWNRLWILQEASTPTEIRFWLGDHSFGLTTIDLIVTWTRTYRTVPGFPPQFARFCDSDCNVGRVHDLRSDREAYGNYSLLNCMQHMRGSLCADALDRVYAPLSLADDVLTESIPTDYQIDVDDLYTKVAQVFIAKSANPLAILGAVYTPVDRELHRTSRPQPALPSWVPDWRWDYVMTGFSETFEGIGSAMLYNPFPGAVDAQIDATRLNVKGLVMRTVEIALLTSVWDDAITSWHTPMSWYGYLVNQASGSPDIDLAIRRSYVGDIAVVFSKDEGYSYMLPRSGTLDLSLFETATQVPSQASLDAVEVAFHLMRSVCYSRRMALLNNGRVAVLPAAAEVGDKIAAFRGGNALYLLRPLCNKKEYTFVGECYVDGWMDGQIVTEAGGGMLETIMLV